MDLRSVTDVGRLRRGVSRRGGHALGSAIERAGITFEVRGQRTDTSPTLTDVHELVEHHFQAWSQPDHTNRDSMEEALSLLSERPATILETGSSAWGTNSSQLFDAYVHAFGGTFATVDLRLGPLLQLRPLLGRASTLARGDSVKFLQRWVSINPGLKVDLVYLDSWDLDVTRPMPAAAHGLNELLAILPALQAGSLLLVDDSPGELGFYSQDQKSEASAYFARTGLLPGKGMLIELYLSRWADVRKIHHGYQMLYQMGAPVGGDGGTAFSSSPRLSRHRGAGPLGGRHDLERPG